MTLLKRVFILLAISAFFISCSDTDVEKRERVYLLHRANLNNVDGRVTFTEVEPAVLRVTIELENTGEGIMHPAHLHFGDISEVGELALVLNYVNGSTGKSVTTMDHVTMTDGELFTFDLLDEMNGSVKIHMNDSYFANMVLCFGNIGQNQDFSFDGVAVCTGH